MKLFKKNQVVIYVIALMLVVAGYLNFTASDNLNTAVQTSSTEEELAKMANIGDAQLVSSNVIGEEEVEEEPKEESKEQEDNTISSNIVEENTIYTSSEVSKDDEIKKINNTKNSIMICENLILVKGFNNCIIFVNGNSVSIIVDDKELTTEKVAQIQNIISREMNAQIENIHISSK